MKYIILADKSYNYIKPIADGLYNSLVSNGQDALILYDGVYWLQKMNLIKVLLADIFRFFKNIKEGKNKYIYRFKALLFFGANYKKEIKSADCIIVVYNCPSAFYRNSIPRVEDIRKWYSGPIVNYDLHYMPNQGWYGSILGENKNNFGLERFDWYLPASLVTEFPLPLEIPQIYTHIGFDIKGLDLFPEQSDFIALLDFPRKGHEKERELQKRALIETNTKYIELNGRYTREEIRSIYRKSSIFFISVRESFCLPVLEVQLCGCLVFTPYKEWLPAHTLNKSIYESGVGELGRNIICYDNCLEQLKARIEWAKENINSNEIISNFKEDYPYYYGINNEALNTFCEKVEDGLITKDSHNSYAQFNKFISTTDKYSE